MRTKEMFTLPLQFLISPAMVLEQVTDDLVHEGNIF